MKFLVLLFLFGCGTANSYEALEKELEDVNQEFVFNFENLGSLNEVLEREFLQQLEDVMKTEIGENLGDLSSKIASDLLELFNEKSENKQKSLGLFDWYMQDDVEKRSLQDYWLKVKDYFKNLQIELKEKYMKFGEWVKDTFKNKFSWGQSEIENIKSIAKEFVDHAKGVTTDVALEAREFLRPYKDQLGDLWDQVNDAVNNVIKNNQ